MRSADETVWVSSVIFSSLSFAPPPLISRRASPLEAVSLLSTRRSRMGIPAFRRAVSIVMTGRLPPAVPCSNSLVAVSAASVAACSPWHNFVASKAKIFLASLMS